MKQDFMEKRKMEMKTWLLSAALVASLGASADTIDVQSFKYAGPYPVAMPWMADSVDVKGEHFAMDKLLDSPLSFDKLSTGKEVTTLQTDGKNAIHLASFTIQNNSRTKATIAVEGLKQYRLFVDGEQVKTSGDKAETTLMPSTHTVVIKYLTTDKRSLQDASKGDAQKTPKVSVTTAEGKTLSVGEPSANTKRTYNIYDVICAPVYSGVQLSPDGKYVIVRKTWVDRQGKAYGVNEVRNYQTSRILATLDEDVRWMPRSCKMYFTQKSAEGKLQLLTINPQTMAREVLAAELPEGDFQFTPDEKSLIFTLTTEGREKDKEVYDIKEPDDRQPGWRTRTNLAKFDLASGILQPITFGYHNIYLMDISADSRYLLVGKNEERLTKRPTTLTSIYRIDINGLQTSASAVSREQGLQVETLVDKGEFVNGAQFSPDGKSLLLSGSPEAFDGIGKNVDEGQTPSMIDTQLYLMSLTDKKVRPMTKDFDPNVQSVEWSKADGNIYFTAEDKDCVHLFQLNPKTGKFTFLKTPEEYIKTFSLASSAAEMAFAGQSASNADRLYKMNTKALKSQLMDDLSARELKGVELGECKAWNYVNSRGDTLCCRYYLPPHFDASKKYPMVVNYYGGCSPTSRQFQSRYPHHVYAAMGYVVLVVNPSGATGFGQKFSARHVDTAGEGVAEDIIGAIKTFCSEHGFVNSKKIGCIGASYGGFMTQYLQTKTDLFAAAISHAGISDHTSYWGEGYWGYSYSEVSMANEYPWTNKHLYVDQSPLYNADKIHTPLLFLHGTADNNVPVGESIQLYTALKLLGRPTAMVLVDGQDHHILEYQRRLKWQNTIFAWFAKWLQDDSSWWNEMYGDEKM